MLYVVHFYRVFYFQYLMLFYKNILKEYKDDISRY